jgi:hypothetical protein
MQCGVLVLQRTLGLKRDAHHRLSSTFLGYRKLEHLWPSEQL